MSEVLASYHEIGFVIIPLVKGTKIPIKKKWQNWDLKKSKDFWAGVEADDYNFGLVCGEVSNIFVLDLDTGTEGFEETKNYLIQRFGPGSENETLIFKSRSGGYHFVFKYSEAVRDFENGPGFFDLKRFGEIRTNGDK